MPVYLLYGFRWPRGGFTGIRVYIVLHNLENATAEYLQQPLTSQLIYDSLSKSQGDIVGRLPDLRFIEQYDPEDTTSETAVSQPFAYVAARVVEIPNAASPGADACWNVEDLNNEPGLSDDASAALEQLRDNLAQGERIGWWIVYNGDPERYFPETDEEDMDEDDIMEEDEDHEATNDSFKGHQQQSSRASDIPSVRFYALALLGNWLRLTNNWTDALFWEADETFQEE